MLRILMIGWEFPPRISGGLGTACAGLVRGLAEQNDLSLTVLLPAGEEIADVPGVTFITAADIMGADTWRKLTSPVEGAYPPPERANREHNEPLPSTKAEIETDNAYAEPSRLSRLLLTVEKYGRAAAHLAVRNPEFDLVHCHDWLSVPAGLAVKRILGIPLVLHMHSLEPDRSGAQANRLIQSLEHRGMMEADQVIAVSEFMRRRIIRDYGIPSRKVEVVHNAIALSFTSDQVPTRRHADQPGSVLFLGRITWQKGPGLFLEAAKLVSAHLPDVHFIMAGEGDLLPDMRLLADELGISKRITFTGFIPPERVSALIRKAGILVLASVCEPFGLVALEAAAQGVPVVLPQHAGATEVLPAAEKFADGNVSDLAEKIERLMRNPSRREVLAKHNFAAVRRCTWQRAARKVTSFYQNLISSDRRENSENQSEEIL